MYKCKKCESNEYVKAGFVKGEQRYKCKKFGCQFVLTRHKGRINQEKLMAVGGTRTVIHLELSPRFLVNVPSVFVWIKKFAKSNISKLVPIDDGVIIELDEMWHFLRSKKDEFGSGLPIAEPQNSSSIGIVAHEIQNV